GECGDFIEKILDRFLNKHSFRLHIHFKIKRYHMVHCKQMKLLCVNNKKEPVQKVPFFSEGCVF
ncbi:hypothetical protein BK789_09535, partial [Bacillus thuringiensis serovar darmstadiensis]